MHESHGIISLFKIQMIDESMPETVHWYCSIVMGKFTWLVRKFNDELKVSLQVDLRNVTSFMKEDKLQETMISKDKSEDLDCFCYDHHDKMKIVVMTCFKKRVHKT